MAVELKLGAVEEHLSRVGVAEEEVYHRVEVADIVEVEVGVVASFQFLLIEMRLKQI